MLRPVTEGLVAYVSAGKSMFPGEVLMVETEETVGMSYCLPTPSFLLFTIFTIKFISVLKTGAQARGKR
jgi:hypothetical protein